MKTFFATYTFMTKTFADFSLSLSFSSSMSLHLTLSHCRLFSSSFNNYFLTWSHNRRFAHAPSLSFSSKHKMQFYSAIASNNRILTIRMKDIIHFSNRIVSFKLVNRIVGTFHRKRFISENLSPRSFRAETEIGSKDFRFSVFSAENSTKFRCDGKSAK